MSFGDVLYSEYKKLLRKTKNKKRKEKLKNALDWISKNIPKLNEDNKIKILFSKDITHIKYNEICRDDLEHNSRLSNNYLISVKYNEIDEKIDKTLNKKENIKIVLNRVNNNE